MTIVNLPPFKNFPKIQVFLSSWKFRVEKANCIGFRKQFSKCVSGNTNTQNVKELNSSNNNSRLCP